jgi:hypothetical protein
MRDYIEIGSTPCEESCQQVGTASYNATMARKECHAFRDQIRRTLGFEPDGAELRIKGFAHDFGTYHEVVCYYDDEKPESVEYAFRCESDAPINWDEQAKIVLVTPAEAIS